MMLNGSKCFRKTAANWKRGNLDLTTLEVYSKLLTAITGDDYKFLYFTLPYIVLLYPLKV